MKKFRYIVNIIEGLVMLSIAVVLTGFMLVNAGLLVTSFRVGNMEDNLKSLGGLILYAVLIFVCYKIGRRLLRQKDGTPTQAEDPLKPAKK